MKRYNVRRFCPAGSRPDCFEVFDTTTGKTASFGMRKHEAIKVAAKMNAERPAVEAVIATYAAETAAIQARLAK